MLKVENLCINYGHIEAVRGISIDIKENEIVALIGANGAGKTSTLMGITGMVEKAGGSVWLDGQDITNEMPKDIFHRGVSYIPEGRRIFPEMTVEENMFMGAFNSSRMLSKGEIAAKKQEMYEFFPILYERRSQYGGTLSGGEQQMLAIARGLMSSPRMIIFDEPSLGLAPIIIDDVYNRIERLKNAGTTILLVEQNASVALDIADRAYVVETGKIAMEGTGRDLQEDERVRKVYLGY